MLDPLNPTLKAGEPQGQLAGRRRGKEGQSCEHCPGQRTVKGELEGLKGDSLGQVWDGALDWEQGEVLG